MGTWRTLVIVLLVAAWASSGQAAEPQALDRYRPQDQQAAIKAVSLGASDRDAIDPARIGTQFAEGVTHVVAWYRWEGAQVGRKINVHWFHEGAKVLEQGEPVSKAAGAEAWVLKTGGGPLPAGGYRVEFLENGRAVTAIPFRIGGAGVVMLERFKPKAAAIKSVSLSASEDDDFDSARIGTEFPAGVPRVVVYFVWEGAASGLRVDSRWLRDTTLVAERTLTVASPTGFGVFSAGPLPAGNYRVELLENGRVVTAIPFRIGSQR